MNSLTHVCHRTVSNLLWDRVDPAWQNASQFMFTPTSLGALLLSVLFVRYKRRYRTELVGWEHAACRCPESRSVRSWEVD